MCACAAVEKRARAARFSSEFKSNVGGGRNGSIVLAGLCLPRYSLSTRDPRPCLARPRRIRYATRSPPPITYPRFISRTPRRHSVSIPVPRVRCGYTMPCGRTHSARNVWMLYFIMCVSQVTELLSLHAASYSHHAHVSVPAPAAGFSSLAGGWRWGAHHQGACCIRRGVRRRSSNTWENKNHCWFGQIRMNVGAEGEGTRAAGHGGPRPKKRALGLLSTGVNDAILEMCVENKGRPLARALTDFVEYTIEALASGERPPLIT